MQQKASHVHQYSVLQVKQAASTEPEHRFHKSTMSAWQSMSEAVIAASSELDGKQHLCHLQPAR